MNAWAERLVEQNPFVAVMQGEIVGMAEIDGDGFIDYFYVHPDWQGQGIGKALLARLELETKLRGVKVIFADVSVTAKEFFIARGFRIVEAKRISIHPRKIKHTRSVP